MKRRYYNNVWAMVCYALLSVTGVAQADDTLAAAGASAKGVITEYFTAKEQGDTEIILSLLGGELLQSEARLLSNPTYPAMLQQWYQDAHFSIIDTNVVDANRITIKADVTFSDARRVHYRFLLEKDKNGTFHIHGEDEIM